MAIDFTLTTAQRKLQQNAREFSLEILAPLVKAADEEPDTQKAFQMLKGAYVECHKLGFAMGFLPKRYGGGDVSNLDLQIVAEEITAVDPGFATILLVNGLALMPVAWFGSEEQKRKWIGAATSDPRGEYIAGWTVSEAAGTPGGTANFDHPGASPTGISLVAQHDKSRGQYVLAAPPVVGGEEPDSVRGGAGVVEVRGAAGRSRGFAHCPPRDVFTARVAGGGADPFALLFLGAEPGDRHECEPIHEQNGREPGIHGRDFLGNDLQIEVADVTAAVPLREKAHCETEFVTLDRKSTRLNSSH